VPAQRLAVCVLAVVLVALAPGASAHPHVRFAYQIEPVLEGGRLAALRVVWQMDPLTTMLVSRGIDANRNGSVDPEELDAFARENSRLLAASAYFLQLTQNDRALAFSIAAPLHAQLSDGRMTLSFEVRLDSPAPAEAFALRFFDETWYVALTAADPVLVGTAPCTAVAQTRVLATQGWGAQAVPTIGLTCHHREEQSR
jgi:ABC-type uncharacterized transport system substrate-binding protein